MCKRKQFDPESIDGKIIKCSCFANLNNLNLVFCQKMDLVEMYIIKLSNSLFKVNLMSKTIVIYKLHMSHTKSSGKPQKIILFFQWNSDNIFWF